MADDSKVGIKKPSKLTRTALESISENYAICETASGISLVTKGGRSDPPTEEIKDIASDDNKQHIDISKENNDAISTVSTNTYNTDNAENIDTKTPEVDTQDDTQNVKPDTNDKISILNVHQNNIFQDVSTTDQDSTEISNDHHKDTQNADIIQLEHQQLEPEVDEVDEDDKDQEIDYENEEYFGEEDLDDEVDEEDEEDEDEELDDDARIRKLYKQMPARIYLEKTFVVNAILLSLQSVTTERPKDPVQYVADFLFKYNKELKEQKIKEQEKASEKAKAANTNNNDINISISNNSKEKETLTLNEQ